jgi:hypothetical protein
MDGIMAKYAAKMHKGGKTSRHLYAPGSTF